MCRSLVVVVVVLAVIAAGCGDSDPPATNTASVNQIQSFADQQLELRLDTNQSAEPFTCEEDGDAQLGSAPPRYGRSAPTRMQTTRSSSST